jgi:peroxiredoxin
LEGTDIRTVVLDGSLLQGNSLIFGVPGAFTPVCTFQHVPDFVAAEPALRKSGYTNLICVAPNDPFTLKAWSSAVDPEHKLLFLSDGNRVLASALGVRASYPEYFLGHSVSRYLLTVKGIVVSHIAIEPTLDILTCTRPGDAPSIF